MTEHDKNGFVIEQLCEARMEKMNTDVNNIAEQGRDIRTMFRAILATTFTTMGAAIGALITLLVKGGLQ